MTGGRNAVALEEAPKGCGMFQNKDGDCRRSSWSPS